MQHGKTITREQVARCIENPIKVLKDGREQHSPRAKIYAYRNTANPQGRKNKRMQRLIVHLKPTKLVLGIFKVFWVSTALKSSKLPPEGKMLWQRNEED